ncbi:MAG: hypothetical protein NTX53_05250, partial [candidate division WOR-3 bacterium]|nr:hypothetical protein [candidate division WOR-3 bacterium]
MGKDVAVTPGLNSAPGGAIRHREARGMGYWAVTQVKGLSPEIPVVPVAETVYRVEGSILTVAKRDGANLAGSETTARYQRASIGTRETHDVPARVGANKPLINGKTVPMASWESDQLVVVLKQGNACGAKGLAGEPRGRDTSSGLRTGPRKSTKLNPMTYSTEGEEVVLKSRMREICKSGSVRGLVVDSQKGLATRPTRPLQPWFGPFRSDVSLKLLFVLLRTCTC